MVDHRAIKVSEQFIGAKSVIGDWLVGLFGVSDEVFMRRLHGFDAGRRSQIKAKSQINHGANNGGGCDLAPAAALFCQIPPPPGGMFSQKNRRAEPITTLCTRDKNASRSEFISAACGG